MRSRAPPIYRSLLRPDAGPLTFQRPCFRLVYGFCERANSSLAMRSWLSNALLPLARRHPGIEFVVRRRPGKHPMLKACYSNGRDKVVSVKRHDFNQIGQKVDLLLDSSGAKIRKLAHRHVESTNESVRGIWSALHDEPARGLGNLPRTTGKR